MSEQDVVHEGSVNVYADLGYPNADEMQRKAELAGEISCLIKALHLTQEAAATLLGIEQPQVSRIIRGQFCDISEPKLIDLVARLDHDAT